MHQRRNFFVIFWRDLVGSYYACVAMLHENDLLLSYSFTKTETTPEPIIHVLK